MHVDGPNPDERKIKEIEYAYDFCFEDDFPIETYEGEGNEYVMEGDILNIRTNVDLDYRPKIDDYYLLKVRLFYWKK